MECLNLCEILPIVYDLDHTYQKGIKKSCELAGYQDVKRIYIGSYFCGRYFLSLNLDMLQRLSEWCEENKMQVTLVIPIFSQSLLHSAKEKVAIILGLFGEHIDEITINDYGMLSYIAETYPKSIQIGRLMNKDCRDPRHPSYFKQIRKPYLISTYFKEMIGIDCGAKNFQLK